MKTSGTPNTISKAFGNSSRQTSNSPSPLTSAARPPTSLLFSRGNVVSGQMGTDKFITARPSTAVRGVGYSTNPTGSAGQRFNEIFIEKNKQQTLSYSNATLDEKSEKSPQVKFKSLEIKIANLLESSIVLSANNSSSNATTTSNHRTATVELKSTLAEALNKAKEAFSLDRTLHQFRAQYGENSFHNFDLTYEVFFNLAEQYERNDMYIEALNTYSIMTKNKMLPHVNQLKLNMGNMYYKMGLYAKAIKMYRMALDSVPHTLKQLRLKITHNIGILFVRLGQYMEAASSFDFIMAERADFQSGIHSILCYYAMGDVEKVKTKFRSLCDIQPMETENDLEMEKNLVKIERISLGHENEENMPTSQGSSSNEQLINEITSKNIENDVNITSKHTHHSSDRKRYVAKALKCDELAVYIKQRRNIDKRAITMLVDLISPIIEENYNDGYNWCIDVIKTSNLVWMANELELNKALVYLRHNDVNQAIETLQMYERKLEESTSANALINLTFIYINLCNFDNAAHCINQLKEFDVLQNNPMALVNASIVDYYRKEYGEARNKLECALRIHPYHFEANYNLALVDLQENNNKLAQERFEHLINKMMLPQSVQHHHVYFQLAKMQDNNYISGNSFEATAIPTALQSYLQVLGILAVDTDSRLFNKVGSIYEQLQDFQEANQYYNEAYRINPSDINTASSIGSYYIKLQATEKAIYYYERAVLANPNDANLMLRVASCFRNSFLPPKQYLGIFEKIWNRFPDNLSCIRALVHVTKTLGLAHLNEKYSLEYTRLNKIRTEHQSEQRHQEEMLHSSTSNKGNHQIRAIHHSDPLGPAVERPHTGMFNTSNSEDLDMDDEDINTNNLLPI